MSTTNDEQGKYGKEVRQVPPVDDATRDRIFDRVNAHQVAMDEAEAKAATAPLLPYVTMLGMEVLDDPQASMDAVRDWYEAKIASGELIRRDQLEADTEVGIDCGHHFRHFSIGRHKYSKKIPEAEYNELLRRGAKIIEG